MLAFITRLGERGDLNRATANNLRLAAAKILEVENTPEEVDVRNLDVDDLTRRFETLNRLNYNTTSMNAYKARFRQAVQLYRAYLSGDPEWKASLRKEREGQPAKKQAKKVVTKAPARRIVSSVTPAQEPAATSQQAPADSMDGTRLVLYDLPLRRDLIIRLSLPVDLTEADAERVAVFVRSLAFSQASRTASVDGT